MKDSIVKIKNYEEQGYRNFIAELKLKYLSSRMAYVPVGIDKLTEVHGTAIYKAHLSHLELKKKGIASFFSAQTIETILFQILIKKIYESQQPVLEKHSKVLRVAKYNIADINTIVSHGEKSDNWLSVSSSIFDFEHGESWAFFLGGGKSMWGQGNFFYILQESLLSEYGAQITPELLREIKELYYEFKEILPSSILELVVIHDKENFKKTICFTEGHASNPRSPTTYDELLRASEQRLQARVLAPNSGDPNKIKILRFTPNVAYENLSRFKEEVSKLIDKYNLRKNPIPDQEITEPENLLVVVSKNTSEDDEEYRLLLKVWQEYDKKITSLQDKEQNENALIVVSELKCHLLQAIEDYKNNKLNPDTTKEQAKAAFTNICTLEINRAKILLEKELLLGGYFINLLASLANALIRAINSEGKAVGFQSQVAFFQPAKTPFISEVEEIEKDLLSSKS